ncbi:hypothetical protein TKK_0010203 [Trichogramma kaykai]|uniref:Retroviral polymerase SH3-like domain-containing protein n=1 Tax=Trichogramma kaykai TaxID=54128 RepID=A0ABD2WZK6_9HYME
MCMLTESGLSVSFWGEALMTANYIRNRCPTMGVNGDIPYEKWFGKPPSLKHLTSFGRFVGYSETNKAFRVWIPSMKKVLISRDIKIVDEKLIVLKEKHKAIDDFKYNENSNETLKTIENNNKCEIEIEISNKNSKAQCEELTTQHENQVVINEKRLREESNHESRDILLHEGRSQSIDIEHHSEQDKEEIDSNSFLEDAEEDVFEEQANFASVDYQKALKGNYKEEWKKSICDEVGQILKTNTFEIVNRPKQGNIIDSKLELTNKTDVNGNMTIRKASLVAS